MIEKELIRENINNQLMGLGMQIRYLRDALICTCMNMPISQFVLLDGNCPASEEEQMLFLNRIVSRIDMDFLKDAKSYIFNMKDDELARKFCELDLVVWQLIMLSSRYEEKNETVKHIAGFAGELLQLVYFLKKEMQHEEFFDFYGTSEDMKVALLLEDCSSQSAYQGWAKLEYAEKDCDYKANADAVIDFANHGKFEMRSALEPEKVKELYLQLGEYRTTTGPKNDMGVIDMSKISLSQFEDALWYGCYTGFEESGLNDKLRFVIVHFSKAYIKNWKAYRNCAAKSMGLSYEQLCRYTKDKQFATKLQKVLPLVDYNNT